MTTPVAHFLTTTHSADASFSLELTQFLEQSEHTKTSVLKVASAGQHIGTLWEFIKNAGSQALLQIHSTESLLWPNSRVMP